jgi:hypothetical protein
MTIDELTALAEKCEAQREVVNSMGMMNRPAEIADRVKSAAALRIQFDILMNKEREYREAFDLYVKATHTRPEQAADL